MAIINKLLALKPCLFRVFLSITIVFLLSGCTVFAPSVAQQLVILDEHYQLSPNSARKQLNKIKQQHTQDFRPWLHSGFWSLQEQDIERARIAFRQSLRLNAKSAEAYMGLGICSDQQKQHNDAQGFYRQGLEINPHHSKLLNNYALSFILSKQPIPAIKLLEPLINPQDKNLSIQEHQRLLSNLALAYSLNGDSQKAYNIDKKLVGEVQAEKNRQASLVLSNE